MKTVAVFMLLVFVGTVSVGLGGPLCRMLVQHPEMDRDLDITADQRSQLEDLYEGTEKDIIEARADLEMKRLEMERLMRSEDPDMRDVRKVVNDMGDARSALMLAGIEREIKTRQILGRDRAMRARHAMTMGRGRRGAAGRSEWRSGRQGMRPEGPGRPGMGRMRCHEGMMWDSRGPGQHDMGSRGKMMQRPEGRGHGAGGCKGHMMRGAEPSERQPEATEGR